MSNNSERNRVLVWKDNNGGLHVDPETYLYFFPANKVTGGIAAITRIQEKLEEAKIAARDFLLQNKEGG